MPEAIELTYYSISHAINNNHKIITGLHNNNNTATTFTPEKTGNPAQKCLTPRQTFQLAGQFRVFASSQSELTPQSQTHPFLCHVKAVHPHLPEYIIVTLYLLKRLTHIFSLIYFNKFKTDVIQNYHAYFNMLKILELARSLVKVYGLDKKNVHCLFKCSCMVELLQLLLFATTIYLLKMIDPSKKHAH